MSKNTQTISKKAAKKAAQAAAVQSLSSSSPGAALALAGAQSLRRVTKKSKSPWLSMLSGAAKMAVDLIPMVAPLLLASHAPTQMAAAQNGINISSGSSVGAPLASASGAPTMVGVYNMKPIMSNGKVIGVKITGMDYLGDISTTATNLEGAVLSTVSLNPLSPSWNGTRCQKMASLYERYSFKKLVAMYAPSCAATTAGALCVFIDTDPTDTDIGAGKAGVQKATAHEGAEVGQVWQTLMACYCPDSATQDYYADPSGSDLRLISPGNLTVVATTDLPAATYGALYAMYEIDLKIPQLEVVGLGTVWGWLKNTATGITTAIPMGTGQYSDLLAAGNLTGYYLSNGTNYVFTGWPPGQYLISWRVTSVASAPAVFTTDNVNYTQNSGSGTSIATTGNGMLLLQVKSDTKGNYSLGNFYITTTTNAPTTLWLYVAMFDPSFAMSTPKKMTLQDYESELRDVKVQLAQLQLRMQRGPGVTPDSTGRWERPAGGTTDAGFTGTGW